MSITNATRFGHTGSLAEGTLRKVAGDYCRTGSRQEVFALPASTGLLLNMMVWGIERTTLFRADRDRADVVARLATVVGAGAWTVYAWALLPNHAHPPERDPEGCPAGGPCRRRVAESPLAH